MSIGALKTAAALSLLLLAAQTAGAQTIRGTLREADTGRPITGTLVRLLDARDVVHAGTLSDSAGRFTLTAPRPGEYRLRAEGIGYAAATAPVQVPAGGEAREVELRLATSAVALEGVSVVAARRQRCAVRPEQGLEAYAVWEEVRKALDAAAWTDEQARFTFEQVVYEDVLDARATQIDTAGPRRTGRVRRPFHSVPVERLLREGFVERTDSGTLYYAPDAAVLLSDAFLDHHCFRAVEPHPGEGSLVGLAFEPVQRRDSGITGTLWVDRRSAELRYLEFGYASPYPGVASTRLRGRVEFHRLPGGEWIVRRWWIRSPRVGERPSRTPSGQPTERYVLLGLTEHGGEVLRVFGPGGQTVFSRAGAGAPQLPMGAPAATVVAAAPPPRAADSASPSAATATAPANRPAPAPAPRRRRDPMRIVRAEIDASSAANVLELVESLRPEWLRVRGPQRLATETITLGNEPTDVMQQVRMLVYQDGMRLGWLETLRSVTLLNVESVGFVPPREATQRWGTEAGGGVILISSM